MPKLIVERSKTFIFFFLFFLLSPKLSVVSFFFFDSFLPFFGEENDAVRCKCLACGRFFSNRCCCRRRRLYRLKRSGAYVVRSSVRRSLPVSIFFLCIPKNLLLLGYNREAWRQPQSSHSAVCVCECRRELIDFGACAHFKRRLFFFPSSTRLSLYRMVYI